MVIEAIGISRNSSNRSRTSRWNLLYIPKRQGPVASGMKYA